MAESGVPQLWAMSFATGESRLLGKYWFGAAAGVVVTRAGTAQTTQLRWYDRAGKRLADVTSPGAFYEPAASPDGKQVAVQVGSPGLNRGDVWIFDVSGQDRGRRLTFGGVDTAAWSPDGRWVVYTSRGKGGTSIVRKPADGSGPDEARA